MAVSIASCGYREYVSVLMVMGAMYRKRWNVVTFRRFLERCAC